MNSTNLDPLIREVKGMDVPHHKGDEVIVPILLNPERHFWQPKEEKFYLVSKRTGHECSGSFDSAVEDHALDLRLDLKITYRVRFGDEQLKSAAGEIAQALYDPDGPRHKFENLLKEWIDYHVKQSGGPNKVMLDFYGGRSQLITFLQHSVRERLHLDLFRITIEPWADTAAKDTEELAPFTISAIFRDHESPITFKVEVLTLDILESPGQKILAYVKGGGKPKLRTAVEKTLLDAIRANYRLHDLRGVSVSPNIKQFLKSELRETVGAFGRSVRAFDLRSDASILKLQDFYQFDNLYFPVRVPSHPKAVPVAALAHLQLIDLGLYASSGTVDLREWTRQTLESVITSRMSRHQYLRLAEQWNKEKLLIGQDFDKRAAAIGFQATFCEITADLPHDLIHQTFNVSIVDEQLTTNNSEWKVPVALEASVVIDNVAVLAEKWPTEVQIDKRIRESLVLTMHRVGREHSPKEWYLNFDQGEDQATAPMKKVLQNAVEEQLRTEFGGKLVSFIVTRKLVKQLAELREQTPSSDVSVTRSAFKTTVAYHVVDVDPTMWHRFQAAAPSIEELTKRICRHIEQTFADYDPVNFRRRTNAANLALLNDPQSTFSIQSLMLQQYGLQVYVDHWIRETVDQDKQEDARRFDAEQEENEARFRAEKMERDVRFTVDTVTLGQQARLLTVSSDEEQFDITLLQQEKEAIRGRIVALSPIHDKDDIQVLEERLAELDRRIKGYRSDALQSILKKQAEKKDRQLAEVLDQPAQSSEASPNDSYNPKGSLQSGHAD